MSNRDSRSFPLKRVLTVISAILIFVIVFVLLCLGAGGYFSAHKPAAEEVPVILPDIREEQKFDISSNKSRFKPDYRGYNFSACSFGKDECILEVSDGGTRIYSAASEDAKVNEITTFEDGDSNFLVIIISGDDRPKPFEKTKSGWTKVSFYHFLSVAFKHYPKKGFYISGRNVDDEEFKLSEVSALDIDDRSVVTSVSYGGQKLLDNDQRFIYEVLLYTKGKEQLVRIFYINSDSKKAEAYFKSSDGKNFSRVTSGVASPFMHSINDSIPIDYKPEFEGGIVLHSLYFTIMSAMIWIVWWDH